MAQDGLDYDIARAMERVAEPEQGRKQAVEASKSRP